MTRESKSGLLSPVESETETRNRNQPKDMETTIPRLLQAPLYAVTDEWEHNGYDDSDFYRVVYNPNTRSLARFETGSTRYGGRPWPGSEFVKPEATPPEVWSAAEAVAADLYAAGLARLEHLRVFEPGPKDCAIGTVLRTTRACRSKAAGTIPAGSVGEVFWSGSYGTFYRNGYKQPNRENTRVGLRLRDGSRVFVALSACRLDREPMSPAEIREKALERASKRDFYSLFCTSTVSMV